MTLPHFILLSIVALTLHTADARKTVKSPPPWTYPPPAPPYETPPPYTFEPPPSPDYGVVAPAVTSYVVYAESPPPVVYSTPVNPYTATPPPPVPSWEISSPPPPVPYWETSPPPPTPYELASPPPTVPSWEASPPPVYNADSPPPPVYTPYLETPPPTPTYTVPSPPSSGGSLAFPDGFTSSIAYYAPTGSYSSYVSEQIAAATPSYAEANSAIINTILYVGNTGHTIADGQVRGGAGQLSGLTSGDLQEYADSVIDCAARYGPTTLSLQDRVMLILVDVNAESGFLPWVTASNGGWGSSIGPMQVTPTIWVPLYEQYGDGQNYDPNTIWGNMHIASWAISTIGMNGAGGPGAIAFDGGGHPATWWTGLYYWSGGYSVGAGQPDPYNYYRMLQEGDLDFLGYSTSILDAGW